MCICYWVSLSEPHTDTVADDLVGIYIYVCVVRHAANFHLAVQDGRTLLHSVD